MPFFLLVDIFTKIRSKNCRFLTLYKREKMRYNDKALEKGAWCTAVNLCAECQSYDTNTGKRSYGRAFLMKRVWGKLRTLFYLSLKN